MNKKANMMALVLAILFLVTTVTPLHAPARPVSPTYIETGTLTAKAAGITLATFEYRMAGYRNSRIKLTGTLYVHKPWLLNVRVWIRIQEWFGWWIFGWWDMSDDWDPDPGSRGLTFKKPSTGSYWISFYAYDKKPSDTIHYKVAVCLSVDYYNIPYLYGTTTNFWEFDWNL